MVTRCSRNSGRPRSIPAAPRRRTSWCARFDAALTWRAARLVGPHVPRLDSLAADHAASISPFEEDLRMTRLVFAGGLVLLLQAGVASADSTSTTMPVEKVKSEEPAAAPKEAVPAPVSAPVSAPKAGTAAKPRAARAGGPQVAVLETAKGKIVIRLFDKDAPKTAANFRKLVTSGFYNGIYFHRVIPGF